MLNKLIVAAALAPVAYYAGSLAYDNNIGTNWNEGYVGPNGVATTWPTGPGAPNYYAPVGPQGNDGVWTGSTDYSTYTSGSYMYDLDLNAVLQQANQVNWNKANNGPGAGQPYTQIDIAKFNDWYQQAAAAYANGEDAPPQDFWINPPPYAYTSSNFDPSAGYGGVTVPSYAPSTSLPSVTMITPPNTAANVPNTVKTGQTPQAVQQAMLDAAAILTHDSGFSKDAQVQAEVANVLAELAAATGTAQQE